VVRGHAVSYRIAVHNRGADTAGRVVLADGARRHARILAARSSQGHCRIGRLVICRLGNLKPHGTASVIVKLIPRTKHRRFVNVAVVGAATIDGDLHNNRARATVRILAPPTPPVSCSAAGPIDRPYC
jgi:hypothetical protein